MKRKPVDIVIPIYNAFDDLVLCLRSIRKYTDLTYDRVVLINDCSSDKKIEPYLASVQEENILVVNNEKNMGFSGNVNYGMKLTTDRDVLLLNSDTLVTSGWIDKIVDCAYSSTEIGTVTPLSNCATLCSVPIICQDNAVPANVTIDEFAAIIERCSLKKYPRITVAVGFCMYIKRVLINEIGIFDAQTFERGYGEENDFCNRAELMGYVQVMCDDTFIYHKGTGSFESEQKQKLIEAHEAVLQERYPALMKKNYNYCMKNPEQYIRDNINTYLNLKNGKKNILYVLHSDFRQDADDNIGGTQFHVRDMVNVMQETYNVFVAARVRNQLRLTIYRENAARQTFEFEIGERPLSPMFYMDRFAQIFEMILKAFQIDLVHVHHILNLTFDIFRVAEKLNIPVHLTLHDYYMICPNEKLLKNNTRYCDVCQSEQECRLCLKETRKIAETVDFLSKWRKECKQAFLNCQKIYTPSQSAKDVYLKAYPDIKEAIIPIYHGCEFVSHKKIRIDQIEKTTKMHSSWDYVMNAPVNNNMLIGWAYLEDKDNRNTETYIEIKDSWENRFYVKTEMVYRRDLADLLENNCYEYSGFQVKIIAQMYAKGDLQFRLIIKVGDYFYTDDNIQVFDNSIKVEQDSKLNVAFVGAMIPIKGSHLAYEMIQMEKERLNWIILGNLADEDLLQLKQDNLIKEGIYQRDDLPDLLKTYHVDIICILSILPETFCYTISEALICGIPVMVKDIGALGERVRKNHCGWILPENASARDYVDVLIDLAEHKEKYKEKKKLAEKYQVKTLQEMAEEYQAYYQTDFQDNKVYSFDTNMIFDARVN